MSTHDVKKQQNGLVKQIRLTITDEIVKAMGFSVDGWQRELLGPLLYPPAQLFARFAAGFDRQVAEIGLSNAVRAVMPRFIDGVDAVGVEHIPANGPLLIVSNHPGTYDGFAILSNLSREDLKIIVSGVPFTHSLPTTQHYLLYVTRQDTDRMATVRQAIRHLSQKGALLIFPSGRVDPDPACVPGAREALSLWSPSISLMVRKVPQTQILVAIVSGVLAPETLRNPLTRLRKPGWERQRLAEYVQIMGQLLFKRRYGLRPCITFAKPLHFESKANTEEMMVAIRHQAEQLLELHSHV